MCINLLVMAGIKARSQMQHVFSRAVCQECYYDDDGGAEYKHSIIVQLRGVSSDDGSRSVSADTGMSPLILPGYQNSNSAKFHHLALLALLVTLVSHIQIFTTGPCLWC